MRILIVNDLFPPLYLGGCEVCCREVFEILKSQGHEVYVLTSRQVPDVPENSNVLRVLVREVPRRQYPHKTAELWQMFRREITNQLLFRKYVRCLKPDLVYFWKIDALSLSLPLVLEGKTRAVHFVFDIFSFEWWLDAWRIFWSRKPVLAHYRLFKKFTKMALALLGVRIPSGPFEFNQAHFASRFLLERNISSVMHPENNRVIHWGVDLKRFYPREFSGPARKILFCGRISTQKGLEIAVKSFAKIAAAHPECILTIVGPNDSPLYEKRIVEWIAEQGLKEKIHFKGFVDRAELPEIYRQCDILIFPSLSEEGFGMTLIEAMASGMAVVASALGGSLEIVNPETDSLLFEKGDIDGCARQVIRLLDDNALFEKIRTAARRTVEQKFDRKRLEREINEAMGALN